MPEATLINVNFPGGEPTGVEVTKLGKRIYDDELRLLDEDRRPRPPDATRSTAARPATRRLDGTDLCAVAAGRIAVTPIHFDLTDHGGLDRLRGWGLEEMLGTEAPAA